MARVQINIDIDNIKVDKRYFSFDYKIEINGELKKEDNYNDSYDGEDKKWMKKALENGYAAQLVLENYEFIFD